MIIKFNEFIKESIGSFEKWYDDLEKFFQNNLAYLIDDNYIEFRLDEDDSESDLPCSIMSTTDKSVEWEKIKLDFIPFIELLDTKYILDNSTIFFDENDDVHYFKIEDILEDNINIENINTIMFIIKKMSMK
jgi:hypothetical protein